MGYISSFSGKVLYLGISDTPALIIADANSYAKEVGAKLITSVAIACLMQKTTHVFPIIGGRKVEQLVANLEALEISLSEEQMKFIEGTLPFDPGFPHAAFVSASLHDYGRMLTNIQGRWVKAQLQAP